jgi:hypothetical protein
MKGAVQMQATTIGLDIAKNVFQVHGIDAAERVVVRKRLRRGQVRAFFKALPPCLIGMEACATAHYWARELARLGHNKSMKSWLTGHLGCTVTHGDVADKDGPIRPQLAILLTKHLRTHHPYRTVLEPDSLGG